MAREMKAKKLVDTQANTVKFTFAGGGEFLADANKLPDGIRARLVLHGLAQKLGDTYAGDVDSPEEEVRSLFGELTNGTWSQRAESGGPRITLVAEAMAILHARTTNPTAAEPLEGMVEAAQAALDTLGDAEKKALAKDPAIVSVVEDIKARRQREKAKLAKEAAKSAGPSDLLKAFLGK